MAESEQKLKSLLMKMKAESEEAGLQLNTHKTMIMASGPITSWQIDGETMEIVMDFIFLGSKITVDGDCSHDINMLTLWKKNFDKPQFSSVSQSCLTLQPHGLQDTRPSCSSPTPRVYSNSCPLSW